MACGLYNWFHPKYSSTMRPDVESRCYEKTVGCLDQRNCLLPKLAIQFPAKVLAKLTPQARWRGWERVRLEDAAQYLASLGFVAPVTPNPAEELMILSGGPSNISEAWTALSLLAEKGLLAARIARQTGSIDEYLAAASGLPKNAVLHILPLQGETICVCDTGIELLCHCPVGDWMLALCSNIVLYTV